MRRCIRAARSPQGKFRDVLRKRVMAFQPCCQYSRSLTLATETHLTFTYDFKLNLRVPRKFSVSWPRRVKVGGWAMGLCSVPARGVSGFLEKFIWKEYPDPLYFKRRILQCTLPYLIMALFLHIEPFHSALVFCVCIYVGLYMICFTVFTEYCLGSCVFSSKEGKYLFNRGIYNVLLYCIRVVWWQC